MKPKDKNKLLAELLHGSSELSDELLENAESEIAKLHESALAKIKTRLAKIYEKLGDEIKPSDLHVYNRLRNIERQIEKEVAELRNSAEGTIKQALKDTYKNTYYESAFSHSLVSGFNVGFDVLDFASINAVAMNKYKLGNWTDSLDGGALRFVRQIKATLSEGIAQGYGYGKIASELTKISGVSHNSSLRIIRTEAGRARSAARVFATREFNKSAGKLGLKSYKIWASTHDSRTRDTHRRMDLVKADKDGYFTLPSGVRTIAPLLSGVASEDIHCRCDVINEIKGLDDREVKYKHYDEWAVENGVRLRNTKRFDEIGINKFKRYKQDQFSDSFLKYKFSDDEAGVIKYYTSDDRKIGALNKRLREGKATHKDKIITKLLNQALDKMPDYKGAVYRGIEISNVDNFLKIYSKGGKVNFKQFTSTSFKKLQAYGGNVQYVIESRKGKDISSLSYKEKEKEILFRTDTEFLIKGVEKKEGKYYIKLKEI